MASPRRFGFLNPPGFQRSGRSPPYGEARRRFRAWRFMRTRMARKRGFSERRHPAMLYFTMLAGGCSFEEELPPDGATRATMPAKMPLSHYWQATMPV